MVPAGVPSYSMASDAASRPSLARVARLPRAAAAPDLVLKAHAFEPVGGGSFEEW